MFLRGLFTFTARCREILQRQHMAHDVITSGEMVSPGRDTSGVNKQKNPRYAMNNTLNGNDIIPAADAGIVEVDALALETLSGGGSAGVGNIFRPAINDSPLNRPFNICKVFPTVCRIRPFPLPVPRPVPPLIRR
jgi:hypothetical protein